MVNNIPVKKRRTYTIAQKRRIVAEAYSEPRRIKTVARKYRVQGNQVRSWRVLLELNDRQEVDKRVTSKSIRLRGGGRKKVWSPEFIGKIKEYVDGRREQNYAVSMRRSVAEARRVDPVSCVDLSYNKISSRIRRLFENWGITWRRCTHKAQNTRHSDSIVQDFVKYVQEKMKILKIDPVDCYNCDQTNVHFSQEPGFTYATKGSRTVGIKGAECQNRCTVMLGCNAVGDKIPPFIIFKGTYNRSGRVRKELEERIGYPDMMEFGVQPKAWMDEKLMLDWIEKVWKPFTNAKDNKLTYLLLDECRTHLTENVKFAFSELNTEVDFIPGGYTGKVQVMDVGINKPFKNYIRNAFDDWLVVNVRKPKRQDVAYWVNEAWNNVQATTITRTWKSIGLIAAEENDIFDETYNNDDEGSNDEFDPLGLEL
jgi:transposase-like protein